MQEYGYKKISVLIPFHGNDGWRTNALDWVRKRWKLQLSQLGVNHEVIVNNDEGSEVFNKCRTVNNAAKEANGDLLILADADVFLSINSIAKALKRVSLPGHVYCYPYKQVERLNTEFTRYYLSDQPDKEPDHSNDQNKNKVHGDTGGVILVEREAFETVNGMDERFISIYGGESASFVKSLKTVFKPVNRIQDRLYHLWHPRIHRHKTPNQNRNRALQRQYQEAKTQDQMLALCKNRSA